MGHSVSELERFSVCLGRCVLAAWAILVQVRCLFFSRVASDMLYSFSGICFRVVMTAAHTSVAYQV